MFLGTYGIFTLIISATILGMLFNDYVRLGAFIVYLIAMVAVGSLMFELTKNPSDTL